jgi:hypothetical protein
MIQSFADLETELLFREEKAVVTPQSPAPPYGN